MRNISRKEAFTMMELLAVVIIVSITAAFAVPRYLNVIEKNAAMEGVNILSALRGSQMRYYIEHNNTFASNLSDLDITIPMSTPPRFDQPIVQNGDTLGVILRKANGTELYRIYISRRGTLLCCDDIAASSLCSNLGLQSTTCSGGGGGTPYVDPSW